MRILNEDILDKEATADEEAILKEAVIFAEKHIDEVLSKVDNRELINEDGKENIKATLGNMYMLSQFSSKRDDDFIVNTVIEIVNESKEAFFEIDADENDKILN